MRACIRKEILGLNSLILFVLFFFRRLTILSIWITFSFFFFLVHLNISFPVRCPSLKENLASNFFYLNAFLRASVFSFFISLFSYYKSMKKKRAQMTSTNIYKYRRVIVLSLSLFVSFYRKID
jgi:hypothetical protein